MTWFEALVFGLVQGLTEFLPISSTAHLRIVPLFLGWHDPGAAFSAVVQLGTLVAVFAYFATDIRQLTIATLASIRVRNPNHSPDSRMAWSIAIATIPIAAFGLGFKEFIETEARSPVLIASALIVLALFLIVAERLGKQRRAMKNLRFWHIQVIGLCQALALIPGCSRSGSTIMGGLFIGLERASAARFSFLLGLPAIGASGCLEFLTLLDTGLGSTGAINLVVGICAAAVIGYLSIGFLLRYLQQHRTDLFSVYRIALGAIVLYLAS